MGEVEEMVCVVCMGGDGCVLTWTLCKYDLRKGDLFECPPSVYPILLQ